MEDDAKDVQRMDNKSVMRIMRKKILGAGSCLLQEKEGSGAEELISRFMRVLEH